MAKSEAKVEDVADLMLLQTYAGETPAILLTGATHPRELITVQMVMYELLHLLQGGIINQDKDVQQMLGTNRYYFLPVLNPDGLSLIEEYHKGSTQNTHIIDQRKNQNPNGGSACNPETIGVDLNRNYPVDWKLNQELF